MGKILPDGADVSDEHRGDECAGVVTICVCALCWI